jgi:transcriptional regulator with PAS, ATPase and Fis domain
MNSLNLQSFEHITSQFELRIIKRILRHTHNNQTLAAYVMGISRRTLFSRLAILSEHQLPLQMTKPRRNGINHSMIDIRAFNLWQLRDRYEKKLIQHALELNHGNITHTAKILGLPRSTLCAKKRKLEIP